MPRGRCAFRVAGPANRQVPKSKRTMRAKVLFLEDGRRALGMNESMIKETKEAQRETAKSIRLNKSSIQSILPSLRNSLRLSLEKVETSSQSHGLRIKI